MTKRDHHKGAVNHAYQIDHINETKPQDLHITEKTDFEPENGLDRHEPPHKTTNESYAGKFKKWIIISLKFLVHIVVGIYFGFATYHYRNIQKHECSQDQKHKLCGIQFCNGYGFLVLLVGFIYLGLFYYYIFKPKLGLYLNRRYLKHWGKRWMHFSRTRLVAGIMILALLVAFGIFVFFQTRNQPSKLASLVAPSFFILAGYVFSTDRSAIQWRTVITGLTCQFLLGVICLRWAVGRSVFECIGDKVAAFLGFTDVGSRFVYGERIVSEGVFAFAILAIIFFFSFFISILYYLGAMQWVVSKLGWMLQQILGTTVCESVIASANIFLGMSESPLLIRPYINVLTASEIHSIMASGFATVSGSVLAAYLSFGASAAHLITSSVMAAPAALAISKLYMPETEKSKTTSKNIELAKSEDSSLLDAASSGASNAIPIVLGIVANIVAFVAFIAFLNAVVNWFAFLVGGTDIDFEWLFSKLFIPLAWAMGVPYEDCEVVAKVVATKTIINEFVAYERLGKYIENHQIAPRSASIATFAICGFANPSSLGILIGSLSVMAPKRRSLITAVALRAFVVGSVVCFVSASFAGILMQDEEESQLYDKIFSTLERKNVTFALFQ